MTTDNTNPDPVATAAETAWLEYAKGTYSSTDKRIFVEGFRQGWRAQYQHLAGVNTNETTTRRSE